MTKLNIPKISIITVTYNAGIMLEKTLNSIQKQQYGNKETIVVDGKSTDNSLTVIQRYTGNGTVTQWSSEPDKGIYDAMNKGVNRCSGQWVIFMNAGDTFASDDVLQQVFSNEWDDVDIVYGDVVKDEHIKTAPEHYHLYHRMLFCHQCVFVRRQCLVDIPFDISHRLSADYKFFIQKYQKGARFQYISTPIAIFDTTGVSNSKRSSGLYDNIRVVCETIPVPQRIKFVARLAVPYIMCRLKGK